MTPEAREAIEAAAFRRLVQHLRDNDDVQNIDLMITADFCRNCLSKWVVAAAKEQQVDVGMDEAREWIYGMPYDAWKSAQPPATPEQLAAYQKRVDAKQG
jgi:uncharacterized protein